MRVFLVCSVPGQVDVLAWRSKTSRVHAQIKDFCAILSGLVVAQDYKRGQQLVADKDFDQNADFFQVCVVHMGQRVKWSVLVCGGCHTLVCLCEAQDTACVIDDLTLVLLVCVHACCYRMCLRLAGGTRS